MSGNFFDENENNLSIYAFFAFLHFFCGKSCET